MKKCVRYSRFHRSGTARILHIRSLSHLFHLLLQFVEWSGIESGATFAGLSNYLNILSDNVFWMSLENNLLLVVASLLTQLPLGLLLALLLFGPDPGCARSSVRSIFFPC